MTAKALVVNPRQELLFAAREWFGSDDWKDQDLLFLSQALMYACLPYKKTRKQSVTRRINSKQGIITIRVTAVAHEDGIPLPYGKDRVILACVLTKARQKGRAAVTFEEIEPLLKLFGEDYKDYGGADYKRFTDRLDRLANCAIQITRREQPVPVKEGGNNFLVAKYQLPERKRGRKGVRSVTLRPVEEEEIVYALQIGADFWKDYMQYCVPMPVVLMKLFADYPTAWDIATLVHWGSYACIQSKRQGGNGRKVFTWDDLLHILGSNDSNPRRVRSTIPEVLTEMRTVWPELRATFTKSGDLVIEVPLHEKLLVQNSNYSDEVRNTIHKSLESADFSFGDGE